MFTRYSNTKQVDILPSKTQVLCNQVPFNVPYDVMSKSHEQRVIPKEHIAKLTNLVLLFNPAVYSNTLLITTFIKVVLSRNSYCNTIGNQDI